jgi:autotransporter-associated beta strand protein
VRIIDVATRQHIMRIYVGGQALRVTVGAMMIVPGGTSDAPLSISDDDDFTALGFGRFITFNGGVLQATRDWSTRRRVSLLASGGPIDTQRFHVELGGGVINDGPLIKHGRGTLTLSGLNTHTSTRVDEGTLIVTGSHAGRIVIGAGGVLAGTGSVGAIEALTGMISPGDATCASRGVPVGESLLDSLADGIGDEGGAMLRATNVTMEPAHALVIDIGADNRASAACDCLAACGTAVLGGARLVLRQRGAVPRGSELVIVTNAAGSFAGIAEGATIATTFGRFLLTYRGGHSGRDVVLIAR